MSGQLTVDGERRDLTSALTKPGGNSAGNGTKKLQKKGLTYFHMTDFEYARSQTIAGSGKLSSKSPYKGWSVDEFDSFLGRLHKIVNLKKKNVTYRLVSFAADTG